MIIYLPLRPLGLRSGSSCVYCNGYKQKTRRALIKVVLVLLRQLCRYIFMVSKFIIITFQNRTYSTWAIKQHYITTILIVQICKNDTFSLYGLSFLINWVGYFYFSLRNEVININILEKVSAVRYDAGTYLLIHICCYIIII